MLNYIKVCISFPICLVLVCLSNSCNIKPEKVTLITTEVSGITQTSAVTGGKISASKALEVIIKGICYSEDENPDLSDNFTNDHGNAPCFVSALAGLKPGTAYYARAYAVFPGDTVFGNAVIFSTQNYGYLSDIEGSFYNTIDIGPQTWMAENLAATRYNDGSAIPMVKGEAAWAGLSGPAYCWYKNDEALFKEDYGALYNWYAVKTGKLCPVGWHVPDDEDWNILANTLGGEEYAGGKLKVKGTAYWVDPNTGAADSNGFSALPGGFRYLDGKFFDFGFSGYWWSSSEYLPNVAWFRFLYYSECNIFRFNNKAKNGFSVRCIKNS